MPPRQDRPTEAFLGPQISASERPVIPCKARGYSTAIPSAFIREGEWPAADKRVRTRLAPDPPPALWGARPAGGLRSGKPVSRRASRVRSALPPGSRRFFAYRESGCLALPSSKDAHPAWGLVGGQGFTKVRSTEADHVGPASGPKR